MYTLKINSNLANANAHIDDINFKNILSEARNCIESDSYPYELDELVIRISTHYFNARLVLKDIKIGEILSQKHINLDSKINEIIQEKGERKVKFLSFISKPFDSLICKILNKKLAEKYASIQNELLVTINQLSKQLEQKFSETGINLKISDIQLT